MPILAIARAPTMAPGGIRRGFGLPRMAAVGLEEGAAIRIDYGVWFVFGDSWIPLHRAVCLDVVCIIIRIRSGS